MAKITIGGVEHEGDLSTFAKLEKAWPLIQAVMPGDDMMVQMGKMVAVAAVALGQDVDVLKRTLKTSEIPGLAPFFKSLMEDSEMSARPGEDEPPVDATPAARPLTEISTPSSPN